MAGAPAIYDVRGLLSYGLAPDVVVDLVQREDGCTRRQAVRAVEAALCGFRADLLVATGRLPG
jgi:hypothetical protein